MKRLLPVLMGFLFLLLSSTEGRSLPPCPEKGVWNNCFGTHKSQDGSKYIGEWQDDQSHGQGAETYSTGYKFVGEFKDGKPQYGRGTYTDANGDRSVRFYEDQPDVNDDYQIHLMYLLAKDSDDRGWDLNGKISEIITKMNNQMYEATSTHEKSGGVGKKYKLDYRKDGKLDITFVRLDKNEAELPKHPNNYNLRFLWKNNFKNPKKAYFSLADIKTGNGGEAGVGMGSVFLKSRYNRAPNKDFTQITLHELLHTQGMGFPCIDGVRRGHILSETNMLGHGMKLDENIYIHDIEGCPQLVDSVFLSPTSKTPYDPYSLVCLRQLGRFNHPKLYNIKESPGRYKRVGIGCKFWKCLIKKNC